MYRKIEISVQTILITIAILVGLWLLLQIKTIIFLVFIAFLLMTAMYPTVLWLERYKIPRAVSIVCIYVIFLGTFGVIVGSAVPALVSQTTTLVSTLPDTMARLFPQWNIDFQSMSSQIAPISANLVSFTFNVFSDIFTTFTVFIITFYFIVERRRVEATLIDFLGASIGKKTTDILRAVEVRLGAWVRGELFLMTLIGVLTYIGLTILHVEFALPLALFAGLLEIVPMIGPIISAIPAVLVALSVSPLFALSVVLLYIIVQQLENNIFVPFVMKKSVGLSPIVTILALMVGSELGGLGGALLAIPIMLVIQAVASSFLTTKNPD